MVGRSAQGQGHDPAAGEGRGRGWELTSGQDRAEGM